MTGAIRPVFYVSDGTGITAETIGHSLLTQFTGTRFATDRIPFVGSLDKGARRGHAYPRAGETAGCAGGGQFLRRWTDS